jgi:glutamine synthetase
MVGFEIEFVLLKSSQPLSPVNKHLYCVSAALPSGSEEAEALEEMADAIQNAGIELLMYHAEIAPAQVSFQGIAMLSEISG